MEQSLAVTLSLLCNLIISIMPRECIAQRLVIRGLLTPLCCAKSVFEAVES